MHWQGITPCQCDCVCLCVDVLDEILDGLFLVFVSEYFSHQRFPGEVIQFELIAWRVHHQNVVPFGKPEVHGRYGIDFSIEDVDNVLRAIIIKMQSIVHC